MSLENLQSFSDPGEWRGYINAKVTAIDVMVSGMRDDLKDLRRENEQALKESKKDITAQLDSLRADIKATSIPLNRILGGLTLLGGLATVLWALLSGILRRGM